MLLKLSLSRHHFLAAAAPVAKAAEKPVEEEVDALDGGK